MNYYFVTTHVWVLLNGFLFVIVIIQINSKHSYLGMNLINAYLLIALCFSQESINGYCFYDNDITVARHFQESLKISLKHNP